MARLTPKQERFVDEYLIDLNATQAAQRAGYSAAYAGKIGSQLLGKTGVAAAIKKRRSNQAERNELTQDEVIAGLRKEARRQSEGSSHSARVRALELLGKHLGMFVDKIAPTDPTGTEQYTGGGYNSMTEEERMKRIAKLLEVAKSRREASLAEKHAIKQTPQTEGPPMLRG
jgi:phage terminase small subunit